MINWCPRCGTGISDLEVNYVPETTKLYFIKYGPFTLATTRPETKLGDTALAVHPLDKRYSDYIGRDIEIESVDNDVPPDQSVRVKKIKIKVVADKSVDPEFGTGIIKVTPAHDITDFEISRRHNLPLIQIINEWGQMNEQMVKDLRGLGLVEKEEEYQHNIGRCDRCDSVIEPLPSNQWFLKTSELAKLAREAIEKKEATFHPARWNEIALRWLDSMRDWNISRQLWWGHKIPVDGETDVLDTWFSSALWPFAVLGWPEKTNDLKEYYPTDFITSDRGIIFLWQLRMIFSGKYFTGKAPFKDIYIHPTVLTKDGKRMSKSLGTGIDPAGLIEKYGTDALRFGLAYQNTGVQDLKFNEEVVMMGRKFANKLWNIARYVLMKTGPNYTLSAKTVLKNSKEVIAKKMDLTIREMTKEIENYEFGNAAHRIYDFVWHDFADKYLEETKDKDDQATKDTLAMILITVLKLLHPFMPFITEEIYPKLPVAQKKLLMIEKWPML